MTTEQAAQIENVLGVHRHRRHQEAAYRGDHRRRGHGHRAGSAPTSSDLGRGDMSALGLDTEVVPMLTRRAARRRSRTSPSSQATDDFKKAQIEEIIGGEATATGAGAMGANERR